MKLHFFLVLLLLHLLTINYDYDQLHMFIPDVPDECMLEKVYGMDGNDSI